MFPSGEHLSPWAASARLRCLSGKNVYDVRQYDDIKLRGTHLLRPVLLPSLSVLCSQSAGPRGCSSGLSSGSSSQWLRVFSLVVAAEKPYSVYKSASDDIFCLFFRVPLFSVPVEYPCCKDASRHE